MKNKVHLFHDGTPTMQMIVTFLMVSIEEQGSSLIAVVRVVGGVSLKQSKHKHPCHCMLSSLLLPPPRFPG